MTPATSRDKGRSGCVSSWDSLSYGSRVPPRATIAGTAAILKDWILEFKATFAIALEARSRSSLALRLDLSAGLSRGRRRRNAVGRSRQRRPRSGAHAAERIPEHRILLDRPLEMAAGARQRRQRPAARGRAGHVVIKVECFVC